MRKFKLFALLLGLFSLVGLTQVVKAESVTFNATIQFFDDGVEDTELKQTIEVTQVIH